MHTNTVFVFNLSRYIINCISYLEDMLVCLIGVCIVIYIYYIHVLNSYLLHAYKYICILYIFVAHLLARANGTSTSGPTQSLQKVTGLPSFSYARSIQIYASYIMIMIHII